MRAHTGVTALSKLTKQYPVKSCQHIPSPAVISHIEPTQVEPFLSNKMVHEDDFSYTNLQNMWSQRDKNTQPLKIKPRNAARNSHTRAKKCTNSPVANHASNCHANPNSSKNSSAKSQTRSSVVKGQWSNNENTIDGRIDVHVKEENNVSQYSEDFNNGYAYSYEEDITKNLMKTNANDLSNPSVEGTFDEENIQPKQLWQDSDSWSADSDGNSNSSNEIPVDCEMPVDEAVADIKLTWRAKHARTTTIDPYNGLDPYDRFDSMSTVNSDVTVKAENKQATALINALQKNKERSISTAFDQQYEGDSNIPDIAFERMAARLTSNITGAKSRPKEIKHTQQSQNTPMDESRSAGGAKSRPKEMQRTQQSQNTLMDESRSSDMNVNTKENIYATSGSLYHNVPRGPLNGVSTAESDVFDGLSDVASSIPSFCRGFFPPELEAFEERPKKQQPPSSDDSSGDTRERRSEYVPERSDESKKKLTQNLAAFAKTNSPPRSSNERRMKLRIPKTKDGKSLSFNPQTLESVGEENGIEDSEENGSVDSEEHGSEDSEENGPLPSRSPIGIARFDESTADITQELSRHFELLTTLPKESSSRRVQSPQEKTTCFSEASSNPIDDERVDDVEEESPFSSDVKSPKSDKAVDIAASVTWIPSMLRLYKRRAKPDSRSAGIQSSPNSVMGFSSRDNTVQLSDCRMSGLGTILLHYNPVYGGEIEEPEILVSNMESEIDENTKHKLRRCIDENSGVKRIKSRRKRKDIFDKAVEVHERALSLFEIGRLEETLEMYETFFECYARKEFMIEDRHEEKHIISNFLFNMGMIYAKMEDCHLASEFFNEALATLEQIDFDDSCSNEIDSIQNEVGVARFGSGYFEEALGDFADLFAIWQDRDVTNGVIQSLNNIGSTYFALGELESCLEAFEEALDVQRFYILNYFGSQPNELSSSNETLKQALAGVSNTLCNLSYVYKATGSPATARFFLEEALTIHKSLVRNEQSDHMHDIIDLLSHLESVKDKSLVGNEQSDHTHDIIDLLSLLEPVKDTCEL